MNTSLILTLALFGVCAANVADWYDCSPLEVTYPFEVGEHFILKSNPPIMKCPHLCMADEQSFKFRELVVKKGGETKTIKALVTEDHTCIYNAGPWGEKIL